MFDCRRPSFCSTRLLGAEAEGGIDLGPPGEPIHPSCRPEGAGPGEGREGRRAARVGFQEIRRHSFGA